MDSFLRVRVWCGFGILDGRRACILDWLFLAFSLITHSSLYFGHAQVIMCACHAILSMACASTFYFFLPLPFNKA